MGKYNLGVVSTEISSDFDKSRLYINDVKVKSIEKDMEKQIDVIRSSFYSINNLLNRAVNQKVVSGSRVDVFKGWAKKSKAQAISAEKLKSQLTDAYSSDLRDYPMMLLNERIAELEKKIANIGN